MNHSVLYGDTARSAGSKGRPWAWLTRGGFAVLAAFCLLCMPTGAFAACGSFGGLNAAGAVKLPMIAQANPNLHAFIGLNNPSIVGLWHVVYTNSADDSTFNDTFDLWHSDGTEIESAFLAPLGGNVCMGVWKQTGKQSVTLHHVGWLFNPNNPTATATNSFTLDQTNTVSPNGKSYTGTFTFKVWNLDGSFTGVEVTGTIAATRIDVN